MEEKRIKILVVIVLSLFLITIYWLAIAFHTRFGVEDEPTGRLLLDESRQLIGLPVTLNSPTPHNLTGKGIVIAILDSGIDCHHPDINDCSADHKGKLWNWHDVLDESGVPVDEQGHGTFIASVIAGTGVNSSGKFKGIAPNASLIVIRTQKYEVAMVMQVVYGLDWLFNESGDIDDVDVISLSLGYDSSQERCTGQFKAEEYWYKKLYEYLEEAKRRGIAVVAAAGNAGVWPESIDFPACMDDVIAVGAGFKKNYEYWEDIGDFDPTENGNVKFHVIVNISGGYNGNYEKEWVATGYKDSEGGKGTGFYITFPMNEPTTVRIRAEGEWKAGGLPIVCPSADVWAPGSEQKGDSYWELSKTLDPGETLMDFYGVVEIGARPIYNLGTCYNAGFCDWCGCGEFIEGIFYQCHPDMSKDDCSGCWEAPGGFEHCYSWVGCKNGPDKTLILNTYLSLDGLTRDPVFQSGRGPAPQGTWKPDVIAPGVDICAARASGTGEPEHLVCGNDNYIAGGGTSISAPIVAGEIALLKEAKPSASLSEIEEALKAGTTCGDVLDPYREGRGMINIKKAVNYLLNPPSSPSGGGGGGNLRPLMLR
ncbi:MAG: S8 family serine peptidase [Candidatus Heimdallarchaeaceae archaeon]